VHRILNSPFWLAVVFNWTMLACLPAHSAVEKNSQAAQAMFWESPLLGKSVSCAVRLPDSSAEKKPVVVYLKNLPAPRLGELDDETLIKGFLDQGMMVIEADYEGDPKAAAPELLPEIDRWYGYLFRTEEHPVDNNWIYILPAGYTIDRKVRICKIGNRPVNMDVFYPSGRSASVPLMLQISSTPGVGKWINQRAYYIYGLMTTGYAGAIMQWTGGDQLSPIGRVFPEKQASRLLRANANKWNLSGKLGVTGHSKGSTRAAMAAFVNESKWENDLGPHADQSAKFQVALISAGRHVRELLIEDGLLNEESKKVAEATLKQRKEVPVEEIRIGSSAAYVTPDDPPVFLSVGELDKQYRVSQMKRLAARCEEVCLEYKFILQKGMGHMYNPAPEVIGEIFRFFDRHLKTEFADVEDLPLQKGLPDPFLMPGGKRVQTRQDWEKQRKYIKAMLAHYLYGQIPPLPKEIEVEQIASEPVYDGKGVEEQYTLTIHRKGKSVMCRFLIVRPSLKKRYPTIIKNDRISFDASPERDGSSQSFDPGAEAVKRGYLLCRFHRTDLASDVQDEGRKAGVYPLYPEYDWGALAVWGWGHGVVLNALDQLGVADMSKVVATGHSRGGKAALCAGIYDNRITITAPNSSGTGGTGSLRYFEEGQKPQTIGHHIGRNEHWFHPRYFQFAEKEDRLPFDAHFAKALIAPRALVNCHARQDYWANPYGTELTHRAAEIVFEWLDAGDRIGLHWREGGHAQNQEDWAALLDFADHHFFDKKTDRRFDNWNYPDAELPFDWKAPDVAPLGGWEDAVLILEAGPRPPANQRTNTNRNQPTMSTEDLLKLTPDGVTVLPDIAYRQGNEAWKLDLAMPKERGDAPHPAIIYIHGGGWTKGDKRSKGIGAVLAYAAKGFVSVSVNYRLDVDKKACVEDVKCATRWLLAHAEQYNIDPNRIGAAGNSAGAHLALMLAVCPASAGLEGDGPYQEYSSMVQAAHCSSTPIMPGFRRGKGANQDLRKIQPMTYISADVPPIYLIHGTLDEKAPVSYVDDFVKALRQTGVKDITYKRYADGTGHGAYVKHIEEARPAREAFFARILKK